MDIQKLHTDQQLRDHVVDQLLSVGGVHKGEDIAILCPFHDDTKPSLNVHVGHKLTPGKFNCFACPAKGSWNKLAYALKLVPVKGSYERNPPRDKSVVVLKDGDEVDPFKLMLSALQTNETYKEYEPPTLTGTEDLPDDFSWQFCDHGNLQLDFGLPAGGYATTVVRELVRVEEPGVINQAKVL